MVEIEVIMITLSVKLTEHHHHPDDSFIPLPPHVHTYSLLLFLVPQVLSVKPETQINTTLEWHKYIYIFLDKPKPKNFVTVFGT